MSKAFVPFNITLLFFTISVTRAKSRMTDFLSDDGLQVPMKIEKQVQQFRFLFLLFVWL